MKRLAVEVDGVLPVALWRGGLLGRFGRFGFGEAMASKSRRTEVP